MSHRKRAISEQSTTTSLQEQFQNKFPNILTPTFGDWKLIEDHRPHPKVTRRNPLFHLMPPKKPITPQAVMNFRALRSEEQSQRIKEFVFEEAVSNNEAKSPMKENKLSEFQEMFDIQQRAFEDVLRQNCIYYKYHKIIDKEAAIRNKKITQILNEYK